MAHNPATSDQVLDWLIANGLIADGDELVNRVLIDIKAGDFVKVYVERHGDERMLKVVPPDLAPSQILEVDRPKP